MNRSKPHAAYFCMEFGLDPSFPIYSGGLGILAGDFIKSAHDLQLPVVAVGLRWERGYGIQKIGADGQPYEEYIEYDHSFLEDTGVRVRVRIKGVEVSCSVRMTTRFGNVPLFLLEPFRKEDRWITHRLYEAGTEVRIAQEMLLGIGGVRALNWLAVNVATYHFNEGHAAFGGLEMIADRMEGGMTFPDAWADTRRRIVFTTHTPVKAGNEEHSLKDLRTMGACLQLSGAEMRAIGGDPFNMTVAGLRLSRRANAVSQLHGETARAMWAHVEGAAPIIAITNGVHRGSWQSPAIAAATTADTLWAAHETHKRELLAEVERRTKTRVEPSQMVLGFARRAAGYKRADLLLRDEARLSWILDHHPLTLVVAGKAHPDDKIGKGIVARVVKAQQRFPGRVLFLENYDMELARLLVHGCDAWLNNPVRPLEASGTSGMKAAMNGLPNVSILDGWWPEGYVKGLTGWAIGDDTAGDDDKDLHDLQTVLTDEVMPTWADRPRWIKLMQASIEMGVTQFSSDRMVKEYFEKLYPPPVGTAPEMEPAPAPMPKPAEAPPAAAPPTSTPTEITGRAS
jgi:starch phosphorylase